LLGAGRANADERKASFAVVPGPFYNPNQGLGVMLMPIVMFHPSADDTVSPPSIAPIFGLAAQFDNRDNPYYPRAGSISICA
jgi:hypothetical protein